MGIKISDNFSYAKLIRFTVPSIFMMIVTSIYGVVDGLFVSNFVGKNAFSSLNLIFPFIMIFGAFGFMLGTGGCALVAKNLGEGKNKQANEIFSLIMYVMIIGSVICAAIAIPFLKPISFLLGATPDLVADCITYGTILLMFSPAYMLQAGFQTFAVVANKPSMGLKLALTSGVTNMILDYLFIVSFEWGIAGAAAASGLSQVVGGIIPFFYFLSKKNNSALRLVKFKWNGRALIKSCANGSSEMMTNLSISLISVLYNLQLMRYLGVNGVSAFGVLMYVSFIFVGVFIGYTIGVSPIVSYHYGAKNTMELQSLYKKSLILMLLSSTVLTLIAELFAAPLSAIFVGYDKELLELTITALRLYSLAYIFSSVNIFASAFFTALNNGKVSALISFLRTLVFQAIMVLTLPYILGINGIWLAAFFAEVLCLAVTVVLLKICNKRYQYYGKKQ